MTGLDVRCMFATAINYAARASIYYLPFKHTEKCTHSTEMLQCWAVSKCIQEQGGYLGRRTNPPPIHKVSGGLVQLPLCIASQKALNLGHSRHTR
jgi:hypothetical protein